MPQTNLPPTITSPSTITPPTPIKPNLSNNESQNENINLIEQNEQKVMKNVTSLEEEINLKNSKSEENMSNSQVLKDLIKNRQNKFNSNNKDLINKSQNKTFIFDTNKTLHANENGKGSENGLINIIKNKDKSLDKNMKTQQGLTKESLSKKVIEKESLSLQKFSTNEFLHFKTDNTKTSTFKNKVQIKFAEPMFERQDLMNSLEITAEIDGKQVPIEHSDDNKETTDFDLHNEKENKKGDTKHFKNHIDPVNDFKDHKQKISKFTHKVVDKGLKNPPSTIKTKYTKAIKDSVINVNKQDLKFEKDIDSLSQRHYKNGNSMDIDSETSTKRSVNMFTVESVKADNDNNKEAAEIKAHAEKVSEVFVYFSFIYLYLIIL